MFDCRSNERGRARLRHKEIIERSGSLPPVMHRSSCPRISVVARLYREASRASAISVKERFNSGDLWHLNYAVICSLRARGRIEQFRIAAEAANLRPLNLSAFEGSVMGRNRVSCKTSP